MNKQRKTSHILNVFQYDADGHVVLPASLALGIAPTGEDNSGKVPTTAWVRSIVGGAVTAYAPTSRTITINGTSYDLSSNRAWSIDTGVMTASAGLGISVSVVNQNLNIVNTGILTASSGAGISLSVVNQNLNVVNTGILTASAGLGISLSVVNQNLNVINTGILTASAGSGISLSVVDQNLNVINTGVLTATAGAGISLSIVGGNLNIVNTITNNNQLTNGAGYITSSALTGYATETYVGTAISNLVDAAPGTLDTLNELAAALGDDPNFATTVSTSIGTKVPQARTITINGTSYDLTANRSWTINSMVYPSAGIALSTGTAWGTSITDNSANWNTAYGWGNHASAGYVTSSTADSTYLKGTTSPGTPGNFTLSIGNNGSYSYVQSHSSQPLELNPVGNAVRISGNVVWHQGNLTNLNQLSNGPGYITGYTETDTLNSVTSRGSTTSNAVTVGLLIAQGPGGNYNENVRLPGSTAVISFNTSGATGAGSYNIVSQTNFQIRNSGGTQVFVMDQSGNLTMTGTVTAPTFSGSLSGNASTATNSSQLGGYGPNQTGGANTIVQRDSNGYIQNSYFYTSGGGSERGTGISYIAGFNSGDYYIRSYTLQGLASAMSGVSMNISGNATTANGANGNFYIDDNYGNTVVGVYTSTRYQGVFAMGDAYKLPADGTTTGSLYGLAWSHPNAGGVAGNLNTHGLLVMENGTFLAAVSGSIRARDDMRAPIFYDSNDTAYYLNPAGGSRLRNLYVGDSGDDWSDPGGWGTQVRFSNGPHVKFVLHARTPGIEAGMYVHTPSSVYIGSYTSHDVSMMYAGSRKMQITNSYIYTDVYLEAAGSLRAPIFYDSNNTSYYGDFASISSMYGVAIRGDLSSVDSSNQIFFWGSGNSTTSAIGFKANGGSFGNPTGFGDGYNTYLTMDTDGRGWVFRRGVGGTDFSSAYTAGWILNNGIWQANAQMRAPQFRFTNSTNNAYLTGNSEWGFRAVNDNGYIQFGPANGTWSHIYSDKSFYFNQELYVNGSQVIHSGNIGSQTVATAGNSNTVGGVGIGNIVRKDTTGQYLRAYYQYGSYLTSETPQNLVNEGIQGGGLRVDFMHPSYTGSGGWNHVITWSGYNGYNMYQLGGHYDGGTGTNLWVRSEANHGLTSWTAWRRLLNTSSDPYAANMNQYVRTSDGPTFTNIYNNGWFRNNNVNEGVYSQATGTHFYSGGATGWTVTGSGGTVELLFRSNHQSTLRGYVYGDTSSNFGLLDNSGNWQVRLNPNNNGGQLYGNWLFSGAIRRSSHSTGFLEGSYNNVGGNSANTNPIYTIGSSYNPSDSSLGSMYGIGYSHPNFWGGGKTSSWGMYVCAGGTINATIGSGAVTIWAENDIVAFSDARVKDNIEVVTNAVEKIQAIRGVTFTRKDAKVEDKDKRHAGVIAQEVLKVMPEIVSGTEKDMYSVAYGNMAALFIEAIKEQQLQIEELKNKLDNVLSSR